MQKIICILIALPIAGWAGAPGPDSPWTLESVDDSSGYGTVAALYQDSAKSIADESGGNTVTPRLEFRCAPGDPTVTASIDWRRFISSFSTEVGFKVDGGRFTWLKWKVDASEQVTLSPSGVDSSKLIGVLQSGKNLLVEVSPYSQGPETAEFDLGGFAAALDELISQCQ